MDDSQVGVSKDVKEEKRNLRVKDTVEGKSKYTLKGKRKWFTPKVNKVTGILREIGLQRY